MTMANESPADPGASFREFVTTWERNLNSLANQVMGTESFSRLMQEAQRMQLVLQQATSEAMGRRLTALNMPTREDIIRLAEKLTDVDRRLMRIEASLDGDATVVADVAPRAAKRRTRKPPAEYLNEDLTQEKPR
jgi:hypothetical protein